MEYNNEISMLLRFEVLKLVIKQLASQLKRIKSKYQHRLCLQKHEGKGTYLMPPEFLKTTYC